MNVPATSNDAAAIENVLVRGDLSALTEAQRTQYYMRVCESLGLNPATRPFDYITLSGKLTLYARRDAADQLRKLHGISVEVVSRDLSGNLLTVHVRATAKDGRADEDFGVVPFTGGAGEVAANAIMKAVTKAKRRVTLSICGLGFLDETELGFAKDETARDEPLPVSKEQLTQLIERADTVKADKRAFCEYLSKRYDRTIAGLANIPASEFEDAMALLNQSKGKGR